MTNIISYTDQKLGHQGEHLKINHCIIVLKMFLSTAVKKIINCTEERSFSVRKTRRKLHEV